MSGGPTLLEVFISWFPMLLLIAVWMFFMWRGGLLGKHKMTQSRYLEEILMETKRHNAVLEDILKHTREQLDRLGAASN